MDMLQFLDRGHIYMVGDRRIPCVSDLCRFLTRETYKDAPLWQLEVAASRGNAVHCATEQLDKTGTADIDNDFLPYLEAYALFLKEHEVSWGLIEHSDWSEQYGFAGTIDRYGTLDGLKTLLDIKTTYRVYKPLHGASLNLYRIILEGRDRVVEQQMILHLRKDGTYKLVKFEKDDTVPMALITLHNSLKTKRRKKNERRTEESGRESGG